MTESYEILATSENSCVIAGAGCGKTEEIVLAVRENNERQLVLTHTHAGVSSLRDRFRKYQIPRKQYALETISGWAMKLAASYPCISGFRKYPTTREEYEQLYVQGQKVLDNKNIQAVIIASYEGFYVDEYQDCTKKQHSLLVKLSKLIPCRILGDPLQGIFDFGDNQIADWDNDVFPVFNIIYKLEYPHRWEENEELRNDLCDLRSDLEEKNQTDLKRFSSITIGSIGSKNKYPGWISLLNSSRNKKGTIVALLQRNTSCHHLAKRIPGFVSIEEMECRKLFDFSRDFDRLESFDLAIRLIEFAELCFTKVSKSLETIEKKLERRDLNFSRIKKNKLIAARLAELCRSKNKRMIFQILQCIKRIDGADCFRKDLFSEMEKVAKLYEHSEFSFEKLSHQVRNMTRRTGRKEYYRIITTPLLIKGLEFDHCIILDPTTLSMKEFYVAATRGKKSLTICCGGHKHKLDFRH